MRINKKRLVGNRDGIGGFNLTYREVQRKECPPGTGTVLLYRRLIGEVVGFMGLMGCNRSVILESQHFIRSEVPFRLTRGWHRNIVEASNASPDSIMSVFKVDVDSLSSFN